MKYKIRILIISVLVGSGFVFFSGCQPKKKDTVFTLPTQKVDSSIYKKNRNTIALRLDSPALNSYNDLIWKGYIDNVFTNREAYKVIRIDTNPNRELTVVSAQLNGDRKNYLIRTAENLEVGRYRLTIYQTSILTFLVKEFDVLPGQGDDNIDDEEGGNFPPFKEVKRLYPNGVIFSVIDAELGVPSYYTIKISLPESIWGAGGTNFFIGQQDSVLNLLAYEDLKKPNRQHDNFHSISPSIGTADFSTSIRAALVTGYDPEELKNKLDASGNIIESFSKDTNPINKEYIDPDATADIDFGRFPDLDPATLGQYKSIEIVVFLSDTPRIDQIYQTKFQVTENISTPGFDQNIEYQSHHFKFRNSFTPFIMKTNLSLKTLNICLISQRTGRLKCVGDNTAKQAGYDTVKEISAHPYQLSFVPVFKNVHQVVGQGKQTNCAILDLDATYKTSSTKCWGSNENGQLGIDDPRKAAFNPDATPPQDPADFLIHLPADAIEISPAPTTNRINAHFLTAGANTFCALTFDDKVYCWGTGINSTDYTTPDGGKYPVRLRAQYNNNGTNQSITNIKSFVVGNGPLWCLIGDVEEASLTNQVFCSRGSVSRIGLTLAAGEFPYKTIIGEGHACVLTSNDPVNIENNTKTDNIFCWGENKYGELGQTIADNPTSQYEDNPAQRANMGGERAIDLVAGAHHTCYVSSDYKMKCVGRETANIARSFTGDIQINDNGFSGSNYLEFGSGVEVSRLSSSGSVLCADLRIKPYPARPDEVLYAAKCWGNYGLLGDKYFLNDSNDNEKLTDYRFTPVIRW